jgi:heme exporter protein C
MRERFLYIIGVMAIALMAWNLAETGARTERALLYIPLGGTAALAAVSALVASLAFLRTHNFQFDALAVAATEVGLAFLAASIVCGCFLTHSVDGKGWNWDARLTAALVCWLLYAIYLMLRHAVEEPSQRAAFAAVWSVFAFLDVPLVVATLDWWKPGTHLRTDWMWPRSWGHVVAMAMVGILFAAVRMRQEEARRELDSLRRMTHAF